MSRTGRWVVVAIGAVVTVAVVALVWWLASDPDRDPSSGPTAAPESMRPASGTPAEGYALAIRTLAGKMNGSQSVPVIYVLDRTCPDVMSAPPVDSDCDTPISAQLRGDLAAALAPESRVEFVNTAGAVTGPELEIVNDGVLTMLGQAQFTGGSGEVPLAVRKGGLNGRGMTHLLSYQDGRWQVTGTTDAAWIN